VLDDKIKGGIDKVLKEIYEKNDEIKMLTSIPGVGVYSA